MNTPGMLANSLSVIGGLILGDFSIQIGWLIPEVVVYGAFVAIANFSQRNYELGYAFKFLRLILLILTWFFNFWGFAAGLVLISTLLPYCTYTAGLKRLTPTVSAVAATIEPVIGTIVGICLFGEKLDFSSFIGMCLILGTVFFFREKSDTSA
jgi:drug/metabolite transporter (DMT)-like permease